VLASLTRYQGLMLGPVALAVSWIMYRRFREVPLKPWLWALGLAIMPLWIFLAENFLHTTQYKERSFGDLPTLFKVLLLNGEAFIAYMPYYLTYPVAIFSLTGMFWMRMRRGPFFGWLMLYVAVALLVAQSTFSSFQERYFLPLMGFFWVLAGAGMYAVQDRWCRPAKLLKRRFFPHMIVATYAFSAAFGLLVVFGQRGAFGDLAKASRVAGDEARRTGALILTNEFYRLTPPRIAANKVAFYARSEAKFLNESYVPPGALAGNLAAVPSMTIPPGTILVLSSSYGLEEYEAYLRRRYRLVPVGEGEGAPGVYGSSLLPLFPDIMERPGVAQNPLAWMFRLEWQSFATVVYRVEGPA
jgi:hypothetical protein